MPELLKTAVFKAFGSGWKERRYYALEGGRSVTLEAASDADWGALLSAAEAQVEEPAAEEKPEVSPIEQEMRDTRDRLKRQAIEFVKSNPECSFEEVIALSAGSLLNGAALLALYQRGAAEQGLIQSDSWPAFREFLIQNPLERLMTI